MVDSKAAVGAREVFNAYGFNVTGYRDDQLERLVIRIGVLIEQSGLTPEEIISVLHLLPKATISIAPRA